MSSALDGAAEGGKASNLGPHLLRDVEFVHHSELVVHLYAALHQLQLREGQVTEVKFVDFVFLGIWKFSLLHRSGVPVIKEHDVLLGPSPRSAKESQAGLGVGAGGAVLEP